MPGRESGPASAVAAASATSPDKHRLQARAAVAEERERRQPTDEAGQGGEEGVASTHRHAWAEYNGAVTRGAHGVLAASAGADVGRGCIGVAANAGHMQQASALPRRGLGDAAGAIEVDRVEGGVAALHVKRNGIGHGNSAQNRRPYRGLVGNVGHDAL